MLFDIFTDVFILFDILSNLLFYFLFDNLSYLISTLFDIFN